MATQESHIPSKQPIANVLRKSAIALFHATPYVKIDANGTVPYTLKMAANDAVLGSNIGVVELASKLADPNSFTGNLPYRLAIAYSKRVEADPSTSLEEVSLDFA